MKEGCWLDDPGEGLKKLFDCGEGRRIYFVRVRLGVSWRTSEVYCCRIECLDWNASCT